jgi:Fe-S-cluster-containing hydrogenase component 2
MNVNANRCSANHPCPARPVGTISQSGNGLPVFAEKECIQCGKCVRLCPMGAIGD